MAFSFTFGGVRSEFKDIIINSVRRSMLQPIAPRTINVPDRVGIYFFKNDIQERTIEVDITLKEGTLGLLRAKIEDISIFLDPTKGVQSLIFDDYTSRTYFAVLSDKTDFDQIISLGKGTLIFLVPDGVSYSSTAIVQNVNTVPSATFTRASVAYLESGSSVASGVQRYEPCAYGQGLRVEEGTTNMLTGALSSFETGLGTAVAIGTNDVISQSFTFAHHGIASALVITGGIGTGEGFSAGYTQATVASTSYTLSCYIIGNGPLALVIEEYTGGMVLITTHTGATFTPNFQTFTRQSLTITTTGTGVNIKWYIKTPRQRTTTFYVDAIQLEQKKYATGWQLGGTARSDEIVKINTLLYNQYLFPQQGTMDFFFKKTGQAGSFGGMFDWGRFSANSTRDRLAIIHGSDITGGEKTIEFLMVSSFAVSATTIYLTLPSDLVVDQLYYLAARWYLDGSSRGFLKLNVADLTNNIEYKSTKNSTLAPPRMIGLTSANFGSLRSGAFWSNCIYDDLRLSKIVRNDTEITDAWELRRPLIKDQEATVKYNFDSTLAGTVISNQGTAPVDPILTLTFKQNTTNPVLIQWTPGASSAKITFQTSGKYTSGTQLVIDSLNRRVTSTTGFLINNRVQLLSDFPRITGDHYFTVTPSTNTDIHLSYTPRWL